LVSWDVLVDARLLFLFGSTVMPLFAPLRAPRPSLLTPFCSPCPSILTPFGAPRASFLTPLRT